ncbi:hypothetical protein LXL04_019655 [Taraxacum kok-saghyz]
MSSLLPLGSDLRPAELRCPRSPSLLYSPFPAFKHTTGEVDGGFRRLNPPQRRQMIFPTSLCRSSSLLRFVFALSLPDTEMADDTGVREGDQEWRLGGFVFLV